MESEPNPQATTEASSSLTDRLLNVIIAPGEAFTDLKSAPVRASNWLAPTSLASIAAIIYIWIAFSQPAVLSNMQAQRDATMQKQIAAGKITQAQADRANAITQQYLTPMILKIASAAASVPAEVGGLFLMGLFVWLGLKAFAGSDIGYMKVVEVCGLAGVINVVQFLLRSWLVLWKENMLVTVSPTFFMANPSPTNPMAAYLSMFDLVDIWWLFVLSLGLSRVASVRYRTAAFVCFGIWFGFRVLLAMLTLLRAAG